VATGFGPECSAILGVARATPGAQVAWALERLGIAPDTL